MFDTTHDHLPPLEEPYRPIAQNVHESPKVARRPPLPKVTGHELKAAKDAWQAAQKEHLEASAECTRWMDRTLETAARLEDARLAYGRAALGYRGT